MHVRAEPAGEALAAVVAGIEDDDDQHGHRQVHRRRCQRGQATRQMVGLVVRGHHHDSLLQLLHAC